MRRKIVQTGKTNKQEAAEDRFRPRANFVFARGMEGSRHFVKKWVGRVHSRVTGVATWRMKVSANFGKKFVE